MPRIARVVVPGLPHHVTQRGNYRRPVFLEDGDYRTYLHWAREYASKYRVSFLAYCLMPNHVHFVLTPREEISLAGFFDALQMRYSQYFNRRLNEQGHLWQGRFFSCVLESNHLPAAVRYVERNSVRAGLAVSPWEWPWSSAAHHVGTLADPALPMENVFDKTGVPRRQWRDFLAADVPGEIESLRKNSCTGRPVGSGAFIRMLEAQLGRRLEALPRGRPRTREPGVAGRAIRPLEGARASSDE